MPLERKTEGKGNKVDSGETNSRGIRGRILWRCAEAGGRIPWRKRGGIWNSRRAK